jgi:uncharacterized membrane protein YvbJ
MFCPFCGRQNKDNALFCEFCGRALTQKNSPLPTTQVNPQKAASKPRLSYNAKRGIVTGVLIVVLVIVILLIYYPSLFPWNW